MNILKRGLKQYRAFSIRVCLNVLQWAEIWSLHKMDPASKQKR